MEKMLEEVHDETDLEDLVFDDKMEAFSWLQACMHKRDEGKFSKKFENIELLWVDKEEIPMNLVEEKEVRKIPSLKTYNLATSMKGKTGVYMRDNSCVCHGCLKGDMLNCKSLQNGEYKHFNLSKRRRVEATLDLQGDSCDDSDEDEDEEFDYSSGEDDDDYNSSSGKLAILFFVYSTNQSGFSS